jgi:cytochrome d ubiquinol oxidase subunit II
MFGFGMEYEGLPFWLPLIWACLIGIAVAMYVLMDGFDLGVGILFNAAHDENWRDRMMLSVAPVWDGNETWLILGGGGLFAVFHLAYAMLMPALYVPIIIMLIALVFRGVAFEFRFKADTSKRLWDHAFHWGSLVATFAQGMVLGAFVQGFQVSGRSFSGGTLDFLTPFSVATGLALVLGYGLLGATWLVMKTTGGLEAWARAMAKRFLIGVILAMLVVSLWVPFLNREIWATRTSCSSRPSRSSRHSPRSGCGTRSRPGAPTARSSWRWACSCWASSASSSACSRTSCRRKSPSGRRRTHRARSCSYCGASSSLCP